MKDVIFDFNNMTEHSIGVKHGATDRDVCGMLKESRMALTHISKIMQNDTERIKLGLEWIELPYQDKKYIDFIQRAGDDIASRYDAVLSLGIGGSYLGLKAAQDALCKPYYNDFASNRNGRPKVYFDGNNLDPETLGSLLKNLNPNRTFVIVISKSGETTETKAAFAIVENWLKKGAGDRYGRQIFVITDPEKGSLRKRVEAEQAKDAQSFRSLPVMHGVGGRFSEFNIGLLLAAISGIRISDILKGAQYMLKRCSSADLMNNPAMLYAALCTILYKKKDKSISVVMPFSEALKSTADWYVQLLAESLGKKYARKITKSGGAENWDNDLSKVLNLGRTPVSSRGTGDLHSIQQNNIEGEYDKIVTFVRLEKFRDELTVTGTGDFLSGKRYSNLMKLAQEGTEWALAQESRPSCTITLPGLTPFYWGALIMFFEMATAFEGELLGVNAFDQPGVESYKNYMYYKLKKTGISENIASNIKSNPLKKRKRFIL